MSGSRIVTAQSNHLWFMTLAYSMIIIMANWFDARIIQIFGLITDAGTIVFPFTFLLSDLITEVYGYKFARRAIWCGFIFNIFFILYGQVIIHLPSPSYVTSNAMFDQVIAINARIVFASLLSYLSAEPLNSYILAKMKVIMHGRYMGLRFILSTIVASGVDSLIFGGLAFYGSMSNHHLVSLIMTMWLIKVIIEIAGLPVSLRLAKKLKQLDQIDMYDINTNFNIFKLETVYSPADNKFRR